MIPSLPGPHTLSSRYHLYCTARGIMSSYSTIPVVDVMLQGMAVSERYAVQYADTIQNRAERVLSMCRPEFREVILADDCITEDRMNNIDALRDTPGNRESAQPGIYLHLMQVHRCVSSYAGQSGSIVQRIVSHI